MKVWTYIMGADTGDAPNFEAPVATLALCRPRVRRRARRGDFVLAFSGRKLDPSRPKSVCWAGMISEVVPLRDYWNDPRFQGKKPGRARSPDNIYRAGATGGLEQVGERRSAAETARDIMGANALILTSAWHFGQAAVTLPHAFDILHMSAGRRGQRYVEIDNVMLTNLTRWLDEHAPVPALDATSTTSAIATPDRLIPSLRARPAGALMRIN
jgi:hypothetical protein